jgi:hypothetical protein
MWFVNSITNTGTEGGTTFGLGRLNGNGTAISDSIFPIDRLDTISHELGHNFGLDHTTFGAGGTQNFMTSGLTRVGATVIGDINPDGQMLDQMTQAQIDRFLSRSATKTIYNSTFNNGSGSQAPWADAFFWTNSPTVSAFPNLNPDVGIFNATVNTGGAYLNQNIIVQNFTQTGGQVSTINGFTQGPASSLQIDDTFNWTAGTQAGLGVTTVAKKLTVAQAAGSQGPQLSSSRTLRMLSGCEGTFSGIGLVGSGSVVFDMQADTTLDLTGNAGFQRLSGSPLIQNAGRINVNAGLYPIQWRLNNNGDMAVRDLGALQLSGGGSGTGNFFLAGSARIDFRSSYTVGNISGNGTVEFSSGTTTISGDYNLDPTMQPDRAGWTNVKGGKVQFNGMTTNVGMALNLTAGVASFANAVTIPRLYLAGSGISDEVYAPNALTVTTEMKWDGPIVSGAGVKTINAPLELRSGALVGGTFRTTGATTFIGPGTMYAGNSAVWRNDGDFDLRGDFSFNVLPPDLGTNPPPPKFDNRGTFTKSAGANVATVDWPMENRGTVKAVTGRLLLNGGYSQQAGNTSISQGAVIESPLAVALAGGSLTGRGTFKAPNLMNNALVAPGESAGRLTIEGALADGGSASLAIELGGLLPGTLYDQLSVIGNTTLGGTLDVSLINGWMPSPTESYIILTGTTVSGMFANTPGNVYTFSDGQFNVLYNPASVVLTNFVQIPEPALSAVVMLGLGLLARRRGCGRR